MNDVLEQARAAAERGDIDAALEQLVEANRAGLDHSIIISPEAHIR